MKKILLTGANGFVGSHILKLLIEKGYFPVALLRSTSNLWRIAHLRNSFDVFISDDHISDLPKLFDKYKIDAVIHTATEYGRHTPLSKILQTNVIFPLQLIESGSRKGLDLFINTDTFFGKKQFNLSYLNDYTTSKRVLESLLTNLSSQLKVVNLRIEHVFGESDDEQKFVTSILKQTIQNSDEILLSEGLQKRDFIYVKDVADAYINILENSGLSQGFQEYEVGTGESISIKELVTKIATATQSKTKLCFGAIPGRSGEIEDSKANNVSLKNIGWQPKYTLDAALTEMILTEKNRFTNEN
ncbi:nucleoside-diphosphate-sugar epimerase [Mucilaginibacter gracilis]|uniref:Nucleoside-diphosphate-sugar epimerase n=1 Tax=Mucilaginibacter gracilis TaxID=423350 RepID=A0A495J1R1_9SPHI|nr:NAD-dependent epimerase/dehydratase [Mucilaginibacter gracilis]RKR82244.1 nucleoside-diphosphate-sugar epimerase [Mucilaginibacter gracilis]